jgi:uncharacterized protein YggU (UPF0235/DUF167 family)
MAKIAVRVKPGSQKGPLVIPQTNGYLVYLRGRPHQGRANQELQKVLSAYFHLPLSQIIIVAGAKSQDKIIQLLGVQFNDKNLERQ